MRCALAVVLHVSRYLQFNGCRHTHSYHEAIHILRPLAAVFCSQLVDRMNDDTATCVAPAEACIVLLHRTSHTFHLASYVQASASLGRLYTALRLDLEAKIYKWQI